MTDCLCAECGNAPVHVESGLSYCRLCAVKRGHDYAFRATVDLDYLRAMLGPELTARVLQECAIDGPYDSEHHSRLAQERATLATASSIATLDNDDVTVTNLAALSDLEREAFRQQTTARMHAQGDAEIANAQLRAYWARGSR